MVRIYEMRTSNGKVGRTVPKKKKIEKAKKTIHDDYNDDDGDERVWTNERSGRHSTAQEQGEWL